MSTRHSELRGLNATLLVVGIVIAVLVVVLAVGVAAHDSNRKDTIAVSETEFKISMPTTVSAGRHTFVVTNRGTEPHELVVFRTVLHANALPRGPVVTTVNEASPLLHTVADSNGSLKPGQTKRIPATLMPGHYVVICNLPSHYGLGMRVNLTVIA